MIFYEKETWIALVLASVPAWISAYFFFISEKRKTALFLLLISAFLLRMVMISLDPFLHEWDERFHALVAKNMMTFPFKPMLFAHPVVVHDYTDWSYNHIWLNKQPLFLWQIALSMKIFGTNLIALRLPSVTMGTIFIWLVYDFGRKWINNDKIAYMAAFIACFSYFSLNLISGRMSTDHNDVAFLFYMTCSFWAFARYIDGGMKLKWALLIGVFAGLAILNKWLTGSLVYGGWGLYIIISPSLRRDLRNYRHFFVSLFVACLVFLPWQIYIRHAFPLESAFVYQFNARHFTEDFGHPGTIFYHLNFLPIAYDYLFLVFLIIGLLTIYFSRFSNKYLTISFLTMVIMLFSFFSIFVKTKMASYPYPVAALVTIISAYGLYISVIFISNKYHWSIKTKNLSFLVLTIIVGIFIFKPWTIGHNCSANNEKRNSKIENTMIYQRLDDNLINEKVIINCRSYENIELMFYKNVTAYHFYPDYNTIDSLQKQGYRFVAFDYEDQQKLPDYIRNDKKINILQEKPR